MYAEEAGELLGDPGVRAALGPADDDLAVYTEFFVRPGGLDDAPRATPDEALRMLGEARAATT